MEELSQRQPARMVLRFPIQVEIMNASNYHGKSKEELKQLPLNQLRHLLKLSRSIFTCSCGPGYHCGDDVLPTEEQEYNKKQRLLRQRCIEALSEIPQPTFIVPSSNRAPVRAQEKKKMRY